MLLLKSSYIDFLQPSLIVKFCKVWETNKFAVDLHLSFYSLRSKSPSLTNCSVAKLYWSFSFLSEPISSRSQSSSPPTTLPQTHPIIPDSNTTRHIYTGNVPVEPDRETGPQKISFQAAHRCHKLLSTWIKQKPGKRQGLNRDKTKYHHPDLYSFQSQLPRC